MKATIAEKIITEIYSDAENLGGEDALDYFKYELRDALKAAGIPAKQFSINFN